MTEDTYWFIVEQLLIGVREDALKRRLPVHRADTRQAGVWAYGIAPNDESFLAHLADDQRCEFFLSDGKAFVRIPGGVTAPVRSKLFSEWLASEAMSVIAAVPGPSAFRRALAVLDARTRRVSRAA